MILNDYGWSDFFAAAFADHAANGRVPGRIIQGQRGSWTAVTDDGERAVALPGRLRRSSDPAALPAVGDWVALRPSGPGETVLEAVLPRRTKLSRKVAGERTREQVVAANVDVVFLVMGLDGDYNLRRLERLLITAWESGARPVVVLSKADLCPDPETRRAEVAELAPGVEVVVLSCIEGEGLEAIEAMLREGVTATLLGSSGVGKSTLINRLCGEELLRTGAVREHDDRGRHTTTHRQLVKLPGGGLLIDNPGIRELRLWASEEALEEAFGDVGELAERCRYRDCTHGGEPGCAVAQAVAEGKLAPGRLASLQALQKELQYLERKQDAEAQRREKKRWASIHKAARQHRPRG